MRQCPRQQLLQKRGHIAATVLHAHDLHPLPAQLPHQCRGFGEVFARGAQIQIQPWLFPPPEPLQQRRDQLQVEAVDENCRVLRHRAAPAFAGSWRRRRSRYHRQRRLLLITALMAVPVVHQH